MSLKEDNKYIYAQNKEQITENLKEIRESKYGSNSSIFLYNKTDFLKVFKKPNMIEHMNELELLRNLKTLTLATSKKFLFIDEMFYGYSMEQKYGTVFYKLSNNTNLSDLLTSLRKIEQDLKILAENHFVATDLNVFNIMFDSKRKRASLIDCDGYFYSKEDPIEFIYLHNMHSLYSLVLYTISNIFDPNSSECEIFKYMNNILSEKIDYSATIDYIFNYFIEILESEVNKDIKTIGEFRKSLILSNKDY